MINNKKNFYKILNAKKIINDKNSFIIEEHFLLNTIKEIYRILENNGIEIQNLKILNDEIVFYWTNNNNNIDIIVNEEYFYIFKVNTEDIFYYKKDNFYKERMDEKLLKSLKDFN